MAKRVNVSMDAATVGMLRTLAQASGHVTPKGRILTARRDLRKLSIAQFPPTRLRRSKMTSSRTQLGQLLLGDLRCGFFLKSK